MIATGIAILRLAAAVLAVVVALTAGLQARELTDAERTALTTAVETFDTAMREKDVETIIGVVPAAVFEYLATQNGVEAEALVAEVITQTEQVMATVTFESFSMDLENAVYKETPDGKPYALIPTDTVMDMGEGGKIKAHSETFAMLEGETWYLIRTDDPATLAIIKELYPSYAAEAFPAGTMEAVE